MEYFELQSNIPHGKEGSGYYGDYATETVAAIEEKKSIFLQALDDVKFEPREGKPFIIVDYGSADGAGSMDIISTFIESIKGKHGKDQEVQVVYEDQPINDFKSLFFRLHGQKIAPRSYLEMYDGIFSVACGTNFYSQCLPSKSVNLGISTFAAMLLHKRPCNLESALFYNLSDNAEEKKMFEIEAKENWERFLLHRANELAHGGQLVVMSIAKEYGNGEINKESPTQSILTNLTKHWKALLDKGVITKDEFLNTTFNAYFRNEEEMLEPLTNTNSEIYKAGLRYVSIDTFVSSDRFHKSYCQERNESEASRKAYANRFVTSLRRWSNSVFMLGLSKSRKEEERLRIVDDFYASYEEDVMKAPMKHGEDLVVTCLHCAKE